MSTVLVLERLPVAATSDDAFVRLVGEFLETMRSAPGCLWAQALRELFDDGASLLLHEWRTEADLDAFQAGEAAARFVRDRDALLAGDASHRRFTGAS